MALQLIQMEKGWPPRNSGNGKWLRNQRNRKIRRTPIDKEPPRKFTGGWEW